MTSDLREREAVASIVIMAVNMALSGVKAPGRAELSDGLYYADKILSLLTTPEPISDEVVETLEAYDRSREEYRTDRAFDNAFAVDWALKELCQACARHGWVTDGVDYQRKVVEFALRHKIALLEARTAPPATDMDAAGVAELVKILRKSVVANAFSDAIYHGAAQRIEATLAAQAREIEGLKADAAFLLSGLKNRNAILLDMDSEEPIEKPSCAALVSLDHAREDLKTAEAKLAEASAVVDAVAAFCDFFGPGQHGLVPAAVIRTAASVRAKIGEK